MSSTVAPHAQSHELEPHIRVGRSRSMVILFIISDFLSVSGLLAASAYLRTLNTENNFRFAGDHPPAFLPGLVVAIALVLSGLIYFWWARRAPRYGETGPSAFFMVALLLMFLALVGQTWVELSLGYKDTPFDAYESLLMLITWYTWVHFLLAMVVGILMLGRILRGRLAGFGFMAEITGYWWYYTILSALLLWIVSLVL